MHALGQTAGAMSEAVLTQLPINNGMQRPVRRLSMVKLTARGRAAVAVEPTPIAQTVRNLNSTRALLALRKTNRSQMTIILETMANSRKKSVRHTIQVRPRLRSTTMMMTYLTMKVTLTLVTMPRAKLQSLASEDKLIVTYNISRSS